MKGENVEKIKTLFNKRSRKAPFRGLGVKFFIEKIKIVLPATGTLISACCDAPFSFL
jgi:hypothetical protein